MVAGTRASSGRGGPLAIAHRAGNDLRRFRAAIAAGVDYAEADVWLYRGRLEVRHDRTGIFQVNQGRWPLTRRRPPRLLLDDLLAVEGGGALLFDLKGTAVGLATALAETIDRAGAVDRVAVSGGWGHLDRLAELLPAVARFYTVGSLRTLTALCSGARGREIGAVSIDRRLVSSDVVTQLRQAGVETIIVWTVQTLTEARRLLAAGVDGITSDGLTLLHEIRGQPAHRLIGPSWH